MLDTSRRRCALAAALVTSLAAAGVASASPVAPGRTVALSGTTAAAEPARTGTVVRDELIPFSIPGPAGVVIQGIYQDRVIANADGALVFDPRIHTLSNPSGPGFIVRAEIRGFGGVSTDVDYHTDGFGDVGPNDVTRSGGTGDELAFRYNPALIEPPDEGRFLSILTDATEHAPIGSVTLYAQNDPGADVFSTTLTGTSAPAVPCAPAISASASADGPWTTVPRPGHVANGALFITAAASGRLVGDGINETTMFALDFRTGPGYRAFKSARPPLASALLTVTITAANAGIVSDGIRFPELGPKLIKSSELRTTPVGETRTVQFELLDYYSSDVLLDGVLRRPDGRLFGYYYDDALVSHVQLDLVPVCTE